MQLGAWHEALGDLQTPAAGEGYPPPYVTPPPAHFQPPPGLEWQSSAWSGTQSQRSEEVEVSVDADGIARLAVPQPTLRSRRGIASPSAATIVTVTKDGGEKDNSVSNTNNGEFSPTAVGKHRRIGVRKSPEPIPAAKAAPRLGEGGSWLADASSETARETVVDAVKQRRSGEGTRRQTLATGAATGTMETRQAPKPAQARGKNHATAVPSATGAVATAVTVKHDGAEGVSLAERVREALEAGAGGAIVDVICDCVENQPLEIARGEVLLRGWGGPSPDDVQGMTATSCRAPGSDGEQKVRLALPGVRVTGGALRISNLALFATEENRVQEGQLQCHNCVITSRNGCGVLCLQKSKVMLTNCEVAHCMRSGIGVNGKNVEVELHRCVVSQNNFSGIGVNHQARSIVLNGNRITDNGYHGVWLNTGVVAHWLGGDMSGNKLSGFDGPGRLDGYSPPEAPGAPIEHPSKSHVAAALQPPLPPGVLFSTDATHSQLEYNPTS